MPPKFKPSWYMSKPGDRITELRVPELKLPKGVILSRLLRPQEKIRLMQELSTSSVNAIAERVNANNRDIVRALERNGLPTNEQASKEWLRANAVAEGDSM